MTQEEKPRRQVGRLEWAVGALGAVVAAAVFGVLGYEAVAYREGPPMLAARVIDVTHDDSGFIVRFETENRGPSIVADVRVTVALRRGGAIVEQGEVMLDYIAHDSSKKAGVLLREDPASGALELRPTSYRAP